MYNILLDDPSLIGGAKLKEELVVTSSEEEYVSTSAINCYPNPFHSSFTIEAKGNFDYELMNQLGEIIEKGSATDKKTIETQLNRGIYIVSIRTDFGGKIKKLVKE